MLRICESSSNTRRGSWPRAACWHRAASPDLREIDFGVSWKRLLIEQRLLTITRVSGLRRLLDSPPLGLFDVAQISHDSLTRPALGANRLDQRPIRVAFAVNRAKVGPQKHERFVRSEKPSSRAVFSTTTRLAAVPTRQDARRTITQRLAPKNPPQKFQISPIGRSTGELGLEIPPWSGVPSSVAPVFDATSRGPGCQSGTPNHRLRKNLIRTSGGSPANNFSTSGDTGSSGRGRFVVEVGFIRANSG